MQLFLICMPQLVVITSEMFKQFDNEGTGSGSRIKYLNALINQVLAKMRLAQPIRAFNHEAHNFAQRICPILQQTA